MIKQILFELPNNPIVLGELRAKVIFDDGKFIIINALQVLKEITENNYKFY